MIFAILIGGALVLFSFGMLGTVLQFYIGSRRDLYFSATETWENHARWGGVFFLLGCAILSEAMLTHYFAAYSLYGGFVLALGWWFTASIILHYAKPGWVSRLENGRAAEDIDAIKLAGAAMLMRNAKHFRCIIRDAAGWESWLMTVTDRIPLAMLQIYQDRVELAIQNHWHPIAVKFAGEIIKTRPDHAHGYILRARAYTANHDFHKAIDDLSISIRLQPQNARLYYERGRLYRLLMQPELASKDFAWARLLDPELYGALRVDNVEKSS